MAGLPTEAVDRVRAAVRLTPGARTLVRTLKRLGYAVGIVSGGFTAVTDDLATQLDLDHALANVLEVVDGLPLASRLQQATDLLDLGGSDRVEAAEVVMRRGTAAS